MSEFLSELLTEGKIKAAECMKPAAYHAAHMLTRKNDVKAPEELILRLSGQKAVQPERTGYRTSSSGLGGGLGARELAELGCGTVVTGCVFEKYALKEALREKEVEIIDITEYVAQAL